jgi:N-carbamoyl-L-amino-acid hydrolase
VGVVSSIVGLRQYNIAFEGGQNHAGTTRMFDRSDACMSAVNFIRELDARFAGLLMGGGGGGGDGGGGDLDAVWTVGTINVTPGTASIIPGTASITVQFRHPSEVRVRGEGDEGRDRKREREDAIARGKFRREERGKWDVIEKGDMKLRPS